MFQPDRARPHRPTLIIGTGLLLLAIVTFTDARAMNIRATYGMGADAASYLVAGMLALLGGGHLLAAWLAAAPEPGRADWRGVLLIAAGLAGLVAAIALGGGFTLGTMLLFALTARAFGRRALAADLAIGAGLGLAVFLLFNKLLTLALPMGPLERLF